MNGLQGITREFGDCEVFLHEVRSRSIFVKVLKLFKTFKILLNFFRKVIVVLYGV